MGINGMSVLIALRSWKPDLVITETHPKVLFRALTTRKYDYIQLGPEKDQLLSEYLDVTIRTSNDYEWDAAASLYAA